MNEQSPINEPEPLNRREARRQRREERLGDPSRGWAAGLILILLGGMFLMRTMGTINFPFQNWWALFILIPAIGAFTTAIRSYSDAGNQFTVRVRSSIFLGTLLTLVSLGFLFNIGWTYFGPVLIILTGIAILTNNLFVRRD